MSLEILAPPVLRGIKNIEFATEENKGRGREGGILSGRVGGGGERGGERPPRGLRERRVDAGEGRGEKKKKKKKKKRKREKKKH